MKKLWCDLRSDAERSDYILSGQAYDAGIIAHAIQADVAMAFRRCSEYDAEVRRLREENERQHFDILAMNQSLDLLREENERLRNIERAAKWYVDNPNSQRLAISQIKAAIDAARGGE